MRGQEVCLLLRRIHASLPGGIIFGLILDGNRPNWDSMVPVSRDPFGDVRCPCALKAAAQARLRGVVHVPVVLHPSRWAPRRCQHLQAPVSSLQHLLGGEDERDQLLSVGLYVGVKVRQVRVILRVVERVAVLREIATVDMHSAHGVSESRFTEVIFDHTRLDARAQLGEHRRGRICEGAPEALDRLTPLLLINVDNHAGKDEVRHELDVAPALQLIVGSLGCLPQLSHLRHLVVGQR
mmetsp:Transcript_7249/g.20487  ORF Transcript_7249/g.20487 Transcript_7249/m.20487 type:complete len:238 (+) Transcript_7249:817-1530(+)